MEKIEKKDINEIVEPGFYDYGIETITSRAIPNVEDGLKPVIRRVLYDMYELNLMPDKPYKKSARIVGDTMGKYHPHGDSSIYGALVTSAQDFREQLPLIDGYGNFGTIDDSEAAMRYTESRLTKYGLKLLEGIDENAVDFIENYDGTEKEPATLPAITPNLMANGDFGLAVGYSPNIPPHNYAEVIDGLTYRIDNPKSTTQDLMKFVKGPDFPEGAIVDPDGIFECYDTGVGKIVMRAKLQIEPLPKGEAQVVITEVPYLVSKEKLISNIAKLFNKDEYSEYGFDKVTDETNKDGTRIVIKFDNTANINKCIDLLTKKTDIECNFSYRFIAIKDGFPHTFTLASYFDTFISSKIQIIKRIYIYRLNKAQKELDKYTAIKLALAKIDDVVAILRSSKTRDTANVKLRKLLSISEEQANIIIDMRLSSLINTERIAIEQKIKENNEKIKNCKNVIKDEKSLKNKLKEMLIETKTEFSSNRKTKIQKFEKMEMKVQEESFVLQANGKKYKKLSETYNGSKGICLKTKSSSIIGVFLENGDFIQYNGNQINSDENYNIVGLFDNDEDRNIFFVTSDGLVKQTAYEEYKKLAINKSVLAIKLNDKQKVVSCFACCEEDEIFIETEKGFSIRFAVNEVRATGRIAGGMAGIKLAPTDKVIRAGLITKGSKESHYKLQKRAGKGCKLK